MCGSDLAQFPRFLILNEVDLALAYCPLPMVPFYKHMGWDAFRAPFYYEDWDKYEQPMFCICKDMAHQKAVRSPIQRLEAETRMILDNPCAAASVTHFRRMAARFRPGKRRVIA
ncbi:MAG: hypothetical protein AAF125_26825 [Chloroflexota bacterium]